MNGFVTVSGKQLASIELDRAFAAARQYTRDSRAKSTWRAYRSDWQKFEAWCQSVGLQVLPATPETVSMFIANQATAGLCPSTLTRRLSAIRLVHLGAGHSSPHKTIQVTEVMRGIRRSWARPPERKAPAIDQDIKRMVDTVDQKTAKGLRDRALLLFGFAGAFRRSELVALNTWNLEYREEGVKVTIEVSKTDQEAQGQTIGIGRQSGSPYCPVPAMKDWLIVSGNERGALFRRMRRGDKIGITRLTAQSVAIVIKFYANKVGLDSSRYSGHSLRRGFLTSAARNRANIFKMADHSRHKSLDILRQYVQEEEMFEDNAGDGLL